MKPRSILSFCGASALLLILSFGGLSQANAINTQNVSLEITQMRSAGNSDTAHREPVVMSIRVTNLSSTAMSSQYLELINTAPLPTRTALWELITLTRSPVTVVHPEVVSSTFSLGPGASKVVSLSFVPHDVFVANTFGLFGVGARLHGSAEQTLVTMPDFAAFDGLHPTQVAFAIQLTTSSRRTSGDPVTGDAIAELSRLDNLTSQLPSVSWLVDPELTSWLDTFSGSDQSGAALSISQRITQHEDTAYLPFAHADLNRMATSNTKVFIQQAIENRLTFYPISNNQINAGSLADLSNPASLHVVTTNFVTQGNSLATSGGRATINSTSVLVADDGITQCTDLTFTSAFLLSHCITSQMSMMTAESPSNARTVFVLMPALWSISPQLAEDLRNKFETESSFALTDLASLLSSPAESDNNAQLVGTRKKFSPTFNTLLARVVNLGKALSSVYADTSIGKQFQDAALVAQSDLWSDDARAVSYLRQHVATATSLAQSIYIETSDRVSLSGSRADIPITIVNDSQHDASVAVLISGRNPTRLSSDLSAIVTIAAGKRQTITVPIEVPGVGSVPAVATLITKSGLPFGKAVAITITSTAYQTFARNLVWGAFGLLLLLAGNTWRKRRSQEGD